MIMINNVTANMNIQISFMGSYSVVPCGQIIRSVISRSKGSSISKVAYVF